MIRAAIITAFLVACGSSRNTTPSQTKGAPSKVPVVDTDRFPHGKHSGSIRNSEGKTLGCIDCHDAQSVREGKVARPGANQHAPCDDGQCHKKEFEKPPGPLCKVCHQNVNPFAKGSSPLQSYPERGNVQTLASNFSHKLHLDKEAMEKASGSHVDCTDCHERNEAKDPMLPGHKACARCHEQAPKVKASRAMEKCDGCHPQNVELTRGRRFIQGDLRFAHATHEKDRSGAAVPCKTCHGGVEDSPSPRSKLEIPKMERCAQCHEDSQRSPDRVRMSECGVCHGAVDLGSVPPNHLISGGSSQRPNDHTLEFRKHHAEQAQSKDAPCRRCHTQLVGLREDTCFQCHQVMKPHDHTMMWRDDHGKDAQTDSTRCANCHAPEVCAGCHSVPPRSHTPLGEFKQGGHAEQARFGLSACMTCHTFQTTCIKCHRGTR